MGRTREAGTVPSGRHFSSKASVELQVAERATLAEWWANYRPNNTSAKSSRKQKVSSREEEVKFRAEKLYSEVHGGVKQVLCVDDDEINQQVGMAKGREVYL
jgi:hypothetical protein